MQIIVEGFSPLVIFEIIGQIAAADLVYFEKFRSEKLSSVATRARGKVFHFKKS